MIAEKKISAHTNKGFGEVAAAHEKSIQRIKELHSIRTDACTEWNQIKIHKRFHSIFSNPND